MSLRSQTPRPPRQHRPTSPDSNAAVVLPFTRSPATAPADEVTLTQAEIDHFVALGHRLRGEAMRGALRRLFRLLVSGCSLRGLRLAGSRQPCC